MDPGETFNNYLSTNAQAFIDQDRWPELGRGRNNRVTWTEDVDLNQPDPQQNREQEEDLSITNQFQEMRLEDFSDLRFRRRVERLLGKVGWMNVSVEECMEVLKRNRGDVKDGVRVLEERYVV